MRILIFNPENDMALASGSAGYTPPANIRRYRQQNWTLPRKWAKDGDVVWDGVTSFAQLGITNFEDVEICPWGWSKAIVHELEQAGVPRRLMPTDVQLDALRCLSSRESTVAVQQELGLDCRVCHSVAEIVNAVKSQGRSIMKSPWSSSGKGLMTTDNANWQGWASRILRLQGCVVVERMMECQRDFAMEFTLNGQGACHYCGLSLFQTDAYGHYLGNIVATESEKEQILYSLSPTIEAKIKEIRQFYLQKLPELAPWYNGPVGVDMLVDAQGVINPCVEINWRMTMGMVALHE